MIMGVELYDPSVEELNRLRKEAADELVYLLDMNSARDRSRTFKDPNPDSIWIDEQINPQARRYVTMQAKYTMACVDARLSELLSDRKA